MSRKQETKTRTGVCHRREPRWVTVQQPCLWRRRGLERGGLFKQNRNVSSQPQSQLEGEVRSRSLSCILLRTHKPTSEVCPISVIFNIGKATWERNPLWLAMNPTSVVWMCDLVSLVMEWHLLSHMRSLCHGLTAWPASTVPRRLKPPNFSWVEIGGLFVPVDRPYREKMNKAYLLAS